MSDTMAAPSVEELFKLIGPEATNLLNLLKQNKQVDRTVAVRLTKAVPLPEAFGFKARALFGELLPFGGLMLRVGTVASSPAWCWLEVEPYGAIDQKYFQIHWDTVFDGMKSLLDEVGAITPASRLGGITFVMSV